MLSTNTRKTVLGAAVVWLGWLAVGNASYEDAEEQQATNALIYCLGVAEYERSEGARGQRPWREDIDCATVTLTEQP